MGILIIFFLYSKLLLAETIEHTVKAKETIFSISRKYDVPVSQILKINKIYNNILKINQKLIINLPNKEPIDINNIVIKKEDNKEINKNDLGFSWPVHGKILAKFNHFYRGSISEGINIAGKEGDLIKSSAQGKVIYVGEISEFGKIVIIKHFNNFISIYGHNKNIIVKVGERIKKGQIISYMGKTGKVSIPQLYFSIRRNNQTYNPEKIINSHSHN